jgi:hypothetical protein
MKSRYVFSDDADLRLVFMFICVQIGEFANDYIEVRRQFSDWCEFKDPDLIRAAAGKHPPITGDRHHVPQPPPPQTDGNQTPSSNEKGEDMANGHAVVPPVA